MLNTATDAFLSKLDAALPEGTRRPVEPRYLEEPRGRWHGKAAAVYAPRDVAGVATIVQMAAEARIGIVPYGGGTGLVTGQVAPEGPLPILVSLERMAAIRSVYPSENILVAEAGATLRQVQEAAEAEDRLFPLSYASEGTARIGGGLSVNSGGINVLRYGSARDLCLGLEAVLPGGKIWNGLKRLRKDNTGYDLRNLLIGAEGTLGIITAATLRLYPRPARTGAAMMVARDPASALDLLALTAAIMGEAVSVFELISGVGLEFLAEADMPVRVPFDEIPDWCVLIEVGSSGSMDPDAALETLFSEALAAGLVSDGLIAKSEAQRQGFWDIREGIPEANKRIGAVASHDVSLPRSAIADFMDRADAAVAEIGDLRVNAFGHLGDGNLHYNVFPAKGVRRGSMDHCHDRVSRLVHDIVMEMGGSFSAEHGIGRLKVGELERYGDPVKLAAMRAIKKALDPAGIMNPGAVLRGQD